MFHIGLVTAGLEIDIANFGTTAIGGSESAFVYMARALGRKSQRITAFCVLKGNMPLKDPVVPSVTWYPVQQFDEMAKYYDFDVLVVSRHIGYALKDVRAGAIYYWGHDIAPQTGFDGASFLVDEFMFLTEYHKSLYEAVLPKGFHDLMTVTRNGIDIDLVRKALQLSWSSKEKVGKTAFCYTSRPERGLMFLLATIWPHIRQIHKDATLHLAFYEVKNMEIPQDVANDIAFCMKLIEDSKHLGVMYHGALDKQSLYALVGSCNALLYPCTFPESSCITAIEAMALGTIPVVTNDYALPETLGNFGELINGRPGTDMYTDAFIETTLKLINWFGNPIDLRERQRMIDYTHAHHDWNVIAGEWLFNFECFFRERVELNQTKVYDQLLYESDVVTVRQHADMMQDDTYRELAHGIISVSQDSPEEYMHGSSHQYWKENGRFLQAIDSVKDQLQRNDRAPLVLDIGCGTGDFLACLHKQYPDAMLVGADFSDACIMEAKRFIRSQPEEFNLDKFDFVVSHVEHAYKFKGFDVVFAGEVLEHVEDTASMLTWLESCCNHGGKVCITTPLGPWSQIAFRKEGKGIERHIHHFLLSDLMALLGGRGVSVTTKYISAGTTERGELIGNLITTWTPAHGVPFGTRDIKKKILVTRPYQKLSACLITNNSEDTIIRCLKSIRNIADEIILGDTGCTDSTLELAKSVCRTQDNLKIIQVPYDIDGDGFGNFAAWRNKTLDEASGDWILVVDTDEQLTEPSHLRKHLQTPSLNGYCIKQVHMCMDMQMPPDEPLRLFRNGRGYLYKGVVHEHPVRNAPGYELIEPFLILARCMFPHDGNLLDGSRYYKSAIRNLPLVKKDRKVNPDRLYGRLMEMRDVLNMCLWARKKYGMPRPEDIVALRNLVHVYGVYFEKPGTHMFGTANNYYQVALSLLASLNVTPFGKRHVPLEVRVQVVAAVGPLTAQAIEKAPPVTLWVKDVEELKRYLDYQTDHFLKALGPLGEPVPEGQGMQPDTETLSLLEALNVP